MARVSLPAFLADQLNGGMLGEELEGEGLHVTDLWIEQDQRSAALLEQVCRSSNVDRFDVVVRAAVTAAASTVDLSGVEFFSAAAVRTLFGFDLAPYQQPVGDDG